MDPIRYWAFALLSLSILALHVTTPHKYVAYIPAIEDNFKVRPAGLEEPLAVAVTLEEATDATRNLISISTKLRTITTTMVAGSIAVTLS